jgi:hypothetical protein
LFKRLGSKSQSADESVEGCDADHNQTGAQSVIHGVSSKEWMGAQVEAAEADGKKS